MKKAVKCFPILMNAAIVVFISSVVCYKLNPYWTSSPVFKLDMAPHSVDDQFINCENQTYRLISEKILPQELKSNIKFAEAWKNFTNSTNNFTRIIAVYTYAPNQLYSDLNNNVSSSESSYLGNFSFKAFHFLLTRAIQIYQVKPCIDVFRRTNVSFDKNVLGHEMRFGRFASTSLKKDMKNFGSTSCFKIKTCFGANIAKMSMFPEEEEVLIPPFEKFKIMNITENQMNCDVLYTLKSTGNFSNMDCELIKMNVDTINGK